MKEKATSSYTLPKTDSSKINELTFELSSCRDDERNSVNQLAQLVVTTWTVLIAAFALVEVAQITKVVFQLLVLNLTVILFSVLCTFIISIGVTGTIRHHYMIHLEDMLTKSVLEDKKTVQDNEQLLHWISFSSPILTLNRKNIKSRYSKDYFINRFLSAIFLTIISLIFIISQIMKIDLSKNDSITYVFIILPIIISLIVVVYAIKTFFYASQNSEEYFNFAQAESIKRWESRNNPSEEKKMPVASGLRIKIYESLKFVMYFLYPRLRDIQKIVYIVIGYIFGYLTLLSVNSGEIAFDFKKLGLTLLITEVLVYQARYQWNDIRGMNEDYKYETKFFNMSKGIPKVLPKNRKATICLSIITLSIKLFVAFNVLIPCYGIHQNMMMYGNVSILLLAILYEISQSYGWGTTTIIFVGWGYPLRFIIGLLAANPMLFSNIQLSGLSSIGTIMNQLGNIGTISTIIILSLGMFGRTFVTLGWVLQISHEKISISKSNNERTRKHLLILAKGIRDIDYEYPLMQPDKRLTWWNISFFLSLLFLSCAQYIISKSALSVLISAIPVIFSVVYSFYEFMLGEDEKKNKRYFASQCISVCYIILVLIYVRVSFEEVNAGFVYIFIAFMQSFYSVVYCGFRNMNLTELYNVIPSIVTKAKIRVLRIIIGKATLEMLKNKTTGS